MHRTTNESPFSLELSCNPPVPLSLARQRTSSEEYLVCSPSQLKQRIVSRLGEVLHEAVEKASAARLHYKEYFDHRVENPKEHQTKDWAYVNSSPVVRRNRAEESPNKQDLSVKLRPKKAGPYKDIRKTDHTITMDIGGLHKVVFIDQITLARRFDEAEQPEEPINGDAQVEQSGELMNGDAQVEQKQVDQPSSSDGLTQQNICQEDEPERREYVVQKIIDHMETEDGTVYCVRWCGYKSQDDTWGPAAILPQHFVARYGQRTQRRQ